ncbi:hypothetical protein ACWKSP_09970 [Micromonosporaceae bacterium Da 78-11]
MTNWMTAAGIALIAGGLATLVSFRAVLFGVGSRRARWTAPVFQRSRPIERPRRPVERGQGVRRRTIERVQPLSGGVGPEPVARPRVDDRRGGLASIGLADDEEDESFPYDDLVDSVEEPEAGEEEFDGHGVQAGLPPVNRSDRGYGDRVDDWVRPEYRNTVDEPPAGEYWTPIPAELELDPEPSAKGYGWPDQVERLPAVPPYEPATGFDLTAEPAEPTEVVRVWPPLNDERPGRIRLPRSWATRNEKDEPDEAATPLQRRARRPCPRPRPDPAPDPSTVYVSRHAADPPT